MFNILNVKKIKNFTQSKQELLAKLSALARLQKLAHAPRKTAVADGLVRRQILLMGPWETTAHDPAACTAGQSPQGKG